GTIVNVAAGISTGEAINVESSKVASVGRLITAVAAAPQIFIGFNDQESGLKTLTEAGAGFFSAGLNSNNTFALCLITGETFTRAPWAVVTGGTGLTLRSGLVGVTQVKGTLFNGGKCAYWTVFTG